MVYQGAGHGELQCAYAILSGERCADGLQDKKIRDGDALPCEVVQERINKRSHLRYSRQHEDRLQGRDAEVLPGPAIVFGRCLYTNFTNYTKGQLHAWPTQLRDNRVSTLSLVRISEIGG